jgi:peptidyl-prolyl cis-trans isomerase C
MPLLAFNLGNERVSWTVGDLMDIIAETPGIEGPKTEDAYGLQLFIWRNVRQQLIDKIVADKGYRDSQEVQDYVDQRLEEFVVSVTYQREVAEKYDQPTGQEVRDFFRSHREEYIEPAKVDLRNLIVPTEADANMIRQQLLDGDVTFEEMVERYSIEGWSASRGGLVEGYGQGEKRLGYLQDVVFDLEVGELSDPFPGPGGYALAEVLRTYPERQFEFKEVESLVIERIKAERMEARLTELLDEIRETVDIEWIDGGLAFVKDPSEVKAERESNKLNINMS